MPRKSQKSEQPKPPLDEQTKPDESQQREAELLKTISRFSTIIHGLENHEPFLMLLEECRKSVELCDNSWHLVKAGDADTLAELRISKLAAQHVMNTFDNCRHDLEMAQKQLVDLIGNKQVIAKYYDSE